MTIWTLALIRTLRLLPRSERFDKHLTECVYADVFSDDGLQVTARHVLKLDPLPAWGGCLPVEAQEVANRIVH